MSNKQELELLSKAVEDIDEIRIHNTEIESDLYGVQMKIFAAMDLLEKNPAPATGQGMGEYKVKRVIADLLEKGLIESQHHKKVLMDFISEPTPQGSGQGMKEITKEQIEAVAFAEWKDLHGWQIDFHEQKTHTTSELYKIWKRLPEPPQQKEDTP